MTCIAKPALHFSLPIKINKVALLLFSFIIASFVPFSQAEETIIESHGFALYGDLKYPQNFQHFDFVNPQAPKGGELRLLGLGSFDS